MEPTIADVAILFLILACAVWGIFNGIIKSALPTTLFVVLGRFVYAHPDIHTYLNTSISPWRVLVLVLGGLLGFVLISGGAHLLHKGVLMIGLGPINQLLGLFLGFGIGCLFTGSLVKALEAVGGVYGEALLWDSFLAPLVSKLFEECIAFLEKLISEADLPGEPWWDFRFGKENNP